MLTKTEIINRAFDGIIAQGIRSTNGNNKYERVNNDENGCRYRDKDGNKCAVGQLIPDNLYNEKLEMVSLLTEITNPLWVALRETGIEHTKENVDLLIDIQRIHDLHPVTSWPAYKEEFLHKYIGQ
jgi:hypothetical protein